MEFNLEEAKEKTIAFLNKTSYSLVRPEFEKYSMIYLFTTENLSYLEKINVYNKDVLTITGSFDQSLNLIFEGAKHICNFDINVLTIYFAKLKIAALKTFSYQEYLNFFLGENSFDYQLFLKLKPYLITPFKEYWEFIYENFSYSNKAIMSSRLFDKPDSIKKVILSNPYLRSEENYNITKEKLNKIDIQFAEKNILEIGEEEKKYDLMLFSNIESYLVQDVLSTMSEEEYIDFIENKASNQLNDNGVIQVAYNYGYKRTIQNNSKNILKRILNSKKIYNNLDYLKDYKKIVFMGYTLSRALDMSNDIQDCIYLYVKSNTKRR